MATGGRVLHHLTRFAPDPRNLIVLPGFQVPGTRGRALLDGATALKIYGRYIPVRAEVAGAVLTTNVEVGQTVTRGQVLARIDDLAILRSGSTARVLPTDVLAPSTIGTWLRSLTFGHIRQLDRLTELLLARAWAAGAGPDGDDLVIDVDSSAPRGAV